MLIKRQINPNIPTGTDDIQHLLEAVLAKGISYDTVLSRLTDVQGFMVNTVIVHDRSITHAARAIGIQPDKAKDILYSCERVLRRM